MADLLTARTLALWTNNDVDVVEADDFAAEVIDKVSKLAQFLGGHDEWDLEPGEDKVPFDVEIVVLQVAKRCYENPAQVVQEGNTGPLGGDRVLDVAALLLSLTETERATLTKYNLDGDTNEKVAELFTLQIVTREQAILEEAILYVGDNQQINLSSSADPREWKIPLFNPGDPGDPNLYED